MNAAKILVIKHGALGDFVLATGAMQAIRAAHPNASMTLLTTPPYADMGRKTGLFEDIWLDKREILSSWALLQRIAGGGFTHVYDLQTSHRTDTYYYLLKYLFHARFSWSGTAWGATWRHMTPHRGQLHVTARLKEQLTLAGIDGMPHPSLNFLPETDMFQRHTIPAPFVVFVPGGSAHRPEKRWPAPAYRALAQHLTAEGYTVVVVGTNIESALSAEIIQDVPHTINLTGKTTLDDLATLGRAASAVVGNDTGPLHILSLAGAPTLVFFSAASDPNRCAAVGPRVKILQAQDLQKITPLSAHTALNELMS